jgi:hypothetical protein
MTLHEGGEAIGVMIVCVIVICAILFGGRNI